MPLAREVVSREAVAAGAVGRWNMSVDYQRRWSVRGSVAGFGQDICDAWASEYSAGAELDTENLVVVDPGNGFSYLFDLAGTLRGEPCSRAPAPGARAVGPSPSSRTAADASSLFSDKWQTPSHLSHRLERRGPPLVYAGRLPLMNLFRGSWIG